MNPLAVTGVLAWSVPNRVRMQTISVDQDTGEVSIDQDFNPTVFPVGFSSQYSLPYLQSLNPYGVPTASLR